MANKTTITNLINSNLADSSTILASEHRAVEIALLDAIYPTPISDTQLTTNVVTKIGTKFTYNLQFSKVGRNIHICGNINNVSGSVLNNVEDILAVTNAEFEPYTTYDFIGSNINGNVYLSFTSDGLILVSSMGVGETIIINQTYQALN